MAARVGGGNGGGSSRPGGEASGRSWLTAIGLALIVPAITFAGLAFVLYRPAAGAMTLVAAALCGVGALLLILGALRKPGPGSKGRYSLDPPERL